MSTAHLYRIVQDPEGNVISGATVSVCNPGTTVPIDDKLYLDQALSNPQTNPFTTLSGVVDIYLPRPQTISLISVYGTSTSVVDYLDVLPSAELVLTTTTPVAIGNDSYPLAILQMQDAEAALWVDADAVAPADAVVEVVPGDNIVVDNSNPARPIVGLDPVFTSIGMNFRSFWDLTMTYAAQDVVLSSARLFVCRTPTTSSLAPIADPAHWTEIGVVHDTNGRLQAADPAASGDVATKNYVDSGVAAQMAYRGAWNSSATYLLNDVVISSSRLWLCVTPNGPNGTFPTTSFVEIAAVHDQNGRLQAADPFVSADLVTLGFLNANSFRNPPAADLAADLGAASARWRRVYTGTTVTSPNTQTLSSPGQVIIDASKSDALITLQANATSSSIINPVTGQLLRITWLQDGTGGRSAVWPTNCRFADGTTGPITTGANSQVTVEFRYDGSNWVEIVRSPILGSAGVPGPPNNPAANVLNDFSFDAWNVSGALTAWITGWQTGSPVISRILAPAAYDASGASVAFSANASNQRFGGNQIHVTPGQVWQVSAWAKGTGTAPQVQLSILLNAPGTNPDYFVSGVLTSDVLTPTAISSDWRLYSGTLLIPTGYGEARFYVTALGGTGDTVQVDRATMMPAASPTTFNGIPAGGSPSQVLVKRTSVDYDAQWGTPAPATPTMVSATGTAQGSGVWTEYAALSLTDSGSVPFSNGAILPAVTGYYEVCLMGGWPANATGRRYLALSVKGSAPADTNTAVGGPAGALAVSLNGTIVIKLSAGTSYTLWALQDSGASLTPIYLAVTVNQIGVVGPVGPQGAPGGIIRQVSTITTGSTLGASPNTDYVYTCNAPATHTMPNAVGNTNRYTIKNRSAIGTNPVITLITQFGQTIDGAANIVIPYLSSLDLISDGSNWWVI